MHDAVNGVLDGAVHSAVHSAIHRTVHDAVYGRMDGAIHGGVPLCMALYTLLCMALGFCGISLETCTISGESLRAMKRGKENSNTIYFPPPKRHILINKRITESMYRFTQWQ